jgi:phospholipase C
MVHVAARIGSAAAQEKKPNTAYVSSDAKLLIKLLTGSASGRSWMRFVCSTVGTIAASALFCASSAHAAATAGDASKIKHIIIIMQENRSFDHYFGTYPGADGIAMAGGKAKACIPAGGSSPCARPYHNTQDVNGGGPHTEVDARLDVNGGKMDGFYLRLLEAQSECRPETVNPNCAGTGSFDVMGYHDRGDIPNYWAYADNFVLQDHMFEPTASWSLPAHLFMVSAWSANCKSYDDASSCINNIDLLPPKSTRDRVKEMLGVQWLTKDWLSQKLHAYLPAAFAAPKPAAPIVRPQSPRIDAQSPNWRFAWTDITYLLHRAGVSWGYYVSKGDEPDCEDDGLKCAPVPQDAQTPGIWNPLPSFGTVRQNGQLGNIKDVSEFTKAAKNGTLPAVSWVIPDRAHSEHPSARVTDGQAYVTGLINAVMSGPNWNDTVIFLAWDDWGGFYDHVVPPTVDKNGYGLRVPALTISPYVKKGVIDHQTLSFDSYLKFIEDVFLNKQRLDPKTDGRPDPRPTVRENVSVLGDLWSEFDFSQAPRPPLLLPERPPSNLR